MRRWTVATEEKDQPSQEVVSRRERKGSPSSLPRRLVVRPVLDGPFAATSTTTCKMTKNLCIRIEQEADLIDTVDTSINEIAGVCTRMHVRLGTIKINPVRFSTVKTSLEEDAGVCTRINVRSGTVKINPVRLSTVKINHA